MIRFHSLAALLSVSLLAACSTTTTTTNNNSITTNSSITNTMNASAPAATDNPFFTPSTLDLHYPRFDLIRNEHYLPAFERGMSEQLAEIGAITAQNAAPDFANTIVPLELSGQLLNRVSSVFFALSSAHTNEAIQALEVELAPRLAEHRDRILLNGALFARVKTVYDARANANLDAESLRLLEQTYKDFLRAGALLNAEDQELLKAYNSRLAELGTRFDQNVLAEVNASAIVVDERDELHGLSDAEIQGAAAAASARSLPGKFVIPLLNTSGQPSLSELENRALRQRIMQTSLARGSGGGDYDNREIVSITAQLRGERAQLLGYPNYAAYVLEEQTARSVAAVEQMLANLTPPAIANAEREAADLQTMIQNEGADFQLAAWDWAYYAEKLRQARYNFDENQLRPYFELNNVLEKGVFYAAEQLYGISFKRRDDLPVYQEDVRVYEVFDADGSTLALFIADPYARANKNGGAWMNDYVPQSALLDTKAIVGNHSNIPKPPAGEPTLLTFDEVITLFHEFGHALHGMFSQVTYPSFSGTNVPRDFVEYPSQVNEMWATWPEVLKHYALHYQSGAPMPEELLNKVLETQKFNQGFATSEYLMASITDMALHVLPPEQVPAPEALMQFEADALSAAGAKLDTLPPRYRLPYFSHIMGGYGAGYYSYIWSEVLDADTVEWFKQNGGMTRQNGQHFRDTLLSRGGSEEAMILFRNFRGRDPVVEPLLERRGLE
ncbi:MAG: M3 family metallopeptidase [Pseudomonadales bacterium]|jgi:peptidyl-dipeptidase Dcp|nr:M3 family metallopeptidase [Pseudomonadales bacterium]